MSNQAGSAWAQPFDGAFYEEGDLTFDDEIISHRAPKYAPDTVVHTSEIQFAWMDEAGCLGLDPDSFFPGVGDSARTARKVCVECPVRRQCLDFANSTDASGIWGGTTEAHRKRAKAA